MSKTTKPPAEPVAKPLRRIFKLAVPIGDGAGKSWSEITLAEPTLGHRAQVQRRKTATATAQTATMLELLSGVPEAALRRLKTRDARAMGDWIDGLIARALRADPLPVDEMGEPLLAPTHTFTLQVPLAGPQGLIREVTVREPDLEAGIAVEAVQGVPAQQTAAMIAALSGLTIPQVMQLAIRDVERMERWTGFFSMAGETSPATSEDDDATTDPDDGPAGAASP